MRNLNNTGAYKALLLAGSAGVFAVASPAYAQASNAGPSNQTGQSADCTANPQDPRCIGDTQTPAPTASTGAIVVTGSRIARQDYQSTSPMVTVDKALLEQSSTAAIEQNLNKLPQFTPAKTPTVGGDIQPTATNTPGAATVSLRGLGANRNLVLLDGRRATPSNASGVVDINTIPSAAVERVEIISGGASATYGADAIAGVTNFILKKNFQGLELDSQLGISQEGDGFEYQVSGIMGSDFADNRGNVSIAMSINTRQASYQRNRSWYQDLWRNPNIGTNRFFPLYPGVALGWNGDSTIPGTASYNAFYGPNGLFPNTTPLNGANNQPLPNTIGQTFATFYSIPGTNTIFGTGRGGAPAPFLAASNQGLQQGDIAVQRATGALNFVDTTPYLYLPLTRYNMFFRGNYELNDWIGVFGQGLYSNTETHTTQQGGSIVSGWDVYIPYGTGVYTGSVLGQPVNVNPVFLPPNVLNTAGQGNISSVILNGQALANGTIYVDATPGVLTDNPTNPAFTRAYGSTFACANAATGGCTNNQLFGQFLPQAIQTLLNNRGNPNAPFSLAYGFPENRSVTNKVSTYNMLAGLEGKIPGTDWTWEAFVNHGVTDTFTYQTGVFSLSRLRALLQSPGFGLNFNTNSNTASDRPAFGSNFAHCTSGMNLFVLPWDQVSQDCKNAIYASLKNNSSVTQTIVEANAQGSLFPLPAGDLRAAIGASYRKLKFSFINDTITEQGTSFLDQADGIYPSSDSFGGYNARELYGELLIPVLKDIPAIQNLSLELGARYSFYNTTGGSWTYKILGDWQITNWLRLRGGFNRAERSPNVAELYQASSQVFGVNALGDLCSERSAYSISANAAATGNTAANAADVKATCAAVMERTGGSGTAAQYYTQRLVSGEPAPGLTFAWVNVVGNPNLKPEVANTWTAGLVVQSPFSSPWLSRLRFTIDWFNIKLRDAIGQQNAGTALQQCLDPRYNSQVTGAAAGTTFSAYDPNAGTVSVGAAARAAANNPYCAGIRYDPSPALGMANTNVTYYNNGTVDIAGIDGQLDWAHNIGPGQLTLNVLVNYYLHYRSKELAVNPLVDYVGTLGTSQNALNPGAFRYRSLTTIGYNLGPARISLQWQHLPKVQQESFATVGYVGITGYPAYDLFNLNASYQLTRDINVRVGVDNLFNTAPPIGGVNTNANITLGQLPGGGFNGGFYDTNGRRFSLGANVRF